MKTKQIDFKTSTLFIMVIMIGMISLEIMAQRNPTLNKTVEVNGVEIFYREAGSKDSPTILLLHGYPTSSHMFRNLMKDLSDSYHLLAPDYPGYGNSEQPDHNNRNKQSNCFQFYLYCFHDFCFF